MSVEAAIDANEEASDDQAFDGAKQLGRGHESSSKDCDGVVQEETAFSGNRSEQMKMSWRRERESVCTDQWINRV